MKRQRALTATASDPAVNKWETGDDDSDPEDERLDSKKSSLLQRDQKARKKRKLVVTEYGLPLSMTGRGTGLKGPKPHNLQALMNINLAPFVDPYGSSSAENSTPSTEGQVSLVLTFSRVSVASCASLISFGPLPWFNWILSNFYWHFECCLTNWKAVVGPILYSPAHFLVSEQALTPHLEQDLHVIILPEYLTSNNDALRNEDIWGSNPYSTDSDAVCILQHSGLYNVLDSSISDDMVGLKVVLRIHPGNTDMPGTERGGIKSKPGSAKFACLSALQFSILRDAESAAIVEQLKRSPSFGPLRPSAVASVEGNPNAMNVSAPETSSTAPGAEPSSSATAPGLDTSAPGTVPSIHIAATGATPISAATASSSSGAVKRSTRRHHRRHVEEVDSRVSIDVLPDTILQFNLSNELAFQYNLNLICDRGIEPSQWTSHRLRNAVLMIETLHKRYELSWEQEAHPHTATNAQFDTYRFALVKTPSSKTRAWHTSHQVPLDSDNATVVHKGLDWSQLIWGPASLTILSNIYSLRRIFWIARATPPVAPVSTSADPKPTGTNGS